MGKFSDSSGINTVPDSEEIFGKYSVSVYC
jgi:hypothetical protein